MEISKWIAELIRNRLIALGIEKKEFAEMIDVFPSEVSWYFTGRHNFTVRTLEKIERAINIKIFANEPHKKENK